LTPCRRNSDVTIDGWKDGLLVPLKHKYRVKGEVEDQKNGG